MSQEHFPVSEHELPTSRSILITLLVAFESFGLVAVCALSRVHSDYRVKLNPDAPGNARYSKAASYISCAKLVGQSGSHILPAAVMLLAMDRLEALKAIIYFQQVDGKGSSVSSSGRG